MVRIVCMCSCYMSVKTEEKTLKKQTVEYFSWLAKYSQTGLLRWGAKLKECHFAFQKDSILPSTQKSLIITDSWSLNSNKFHGKAQFTYLNKIYCITRNVKLIISDRIEESDGKWSNYAFLNPYLTTKNFTTKNYKFIEHYILLIRRKFGVRF